MGLNQREPIPFDHVYDQMEQIARGKGWPTAHAVTFDFFKDALDHAQSISRPDGRGGFLPFLAPLIAMAGPALAAAGPALATGAVSALGGLGASALLKKLGVGSGYNASTANNGVVGDNRGSGINIKDILDYIPAAKIGPWGKILGGRGTGLYDRTTGLIPPKAHHIPALHPLRNFGPIPDTHEIDPWFSPMRGVNDHVHFRGDGIKDVMSKALSAVTSRVGKAFGSAAGKKITKAGQQAVTEAVVEALVGKPRPKKPLPSGSKRKAPAAAEKTKTPAKKGKKEKPPAVVASEEDWEDDDGGGDSGAPPQAALPLIHNISGAAAKTGNPWALGGGYNFNNYYI